MGLSATYWVHCDLCGEDSGAGQISQDDAWDYVQRGGWWVNRGYGVAVCEECFEANPVPHAQYSNVSCVLCHSGEHTRVLANPALR